MPQKTKQLPHNLVTTAQMDCPVRKSNLMHLSPGECILHSNKNGHVAIKQFTKKQPYEQSALLFLVSCSQARIGVNVSISGINQKQKSQFSV